MSIVTTENESNIANSIQLRYNILIESNVANILINQYEDATFQDTEVFV
ncbi:MAG: hypothetical protein K0R21_1228 [Anaerocolumna sp.]|jgi:hypothetical protein|nr:hypothetical protein [Anaerocolumna sp.]